MCKELRQSDREIKSDKQSRKINKPSGSHIQRKRVRKPSEIQSNKKIKVDEEEKIKTILENQAAEMKLDVEDSLINKCIDFIVTKNDLKDKISSFIDEISLLNNIWIQKNNDTTHEINFEKEEGKLTS